MAVPSNYDAIQVVPLKPSAGIMQLPASIEAMPRDILRDDSIESMIPKGTWVYLPDVGTDDTDTFVSASARLQQHGYEPVPHIAARRFPCKQSIERHLGRLAEESGVANCLVIAGESKRAGPYDSTLSLLQSGLLDKFGYREIGIGGHPEGCPKYPGVSTDEVLLQKVQLARLSDAKFRIVTQFGFDPVAFIEWAKNLPKLGIDLPVHLGVAGPCKVTTLMKYALRCGVGNSLRFLHARTNAVFALTMKYSPDDVAIPIERFLANRESSPIHQFHVFPFGGLATASAWLRERGTWEHLGTAVRDRAVRYR